MIWQIYFENLMSVTPKKMGIRPPKPHFSQVLGAKCPFFHDWLSLFCFLMDFLFDLPFAMWWWMGMAGEKISIWQKKLDKNRLFGVKCLFCKKWPSIILTMSDGLMNRDSLDMTYGGGTLKRSGSPMRSQGLRESAAWIVKIYFMGAHDIQGFASEVAHGK